MKGLTGGGQSGGDRGGTSVTTCTSVSIVLCNSLLDILVPLSGTEKSSTRGDYITSPACVYITQAAEAFHSSEPISRSRPEIIDLDLKTDRFYNKSDRHGNCVAIRAAVPFCRRQTVGSLKLVKIKQ